MATRVCGRVKVNVTWVDRDNQYRCALSVGGKRRGTQYVGAPASMRQAVDSAAAYDSAARAAVSFALSDGMISDSDCDFTDAGPNISRSSTARRSPAPTARKRPTTARKRPTTARKRSTAAGRLYAYTGRAGGTTTGRR